MTDMDLHAEFVGLGKPLRMTARGCLSDRLLELEDRNKVIVTAVERHLSKLGLEVDPWSGWLVRHVDRSDVGATYEVHVVVQDQHHEVVLVEVPLDELVLHADLLDLLSHVRKVAEA